mgnify:CR=1 FL=1
MAKCQRCGRDVTTDFCPYCGIKISGNSLESVEKLPGSWQKALIYGGAVVAAVVVWFILMRLFF